MASMRERWATMKQAFNLNNASVDNTAKAVEMIDQSGLGSQDLTQKSRDLAGAMNRSRKDAERSAQEEVKLQREIDALEKEVKVFQRQRSETEEERRRLQSEVAGLKERLQEARHALEVLGGQLIEQENIEKDLMSTLGQLTEECENLSSELERLQSEIRCHEAMLRDIEEKRTQAQLKGEELQREDKALAYRQQEVAEELQDLAQQLARMTDEIDKLRDKLEQLSRDKEQVEQEILEAIEKENDLTAEAADLDRDSTNESNLAGQDKAEMDRLDRELLQLQQQMDGIKDYTRKEKSGCSSYTVTVSRQPERSVVQGRIDLNRERYREFSTSRAAHLKEARDSSKLADQRRREARQQATRLVGLRRKLGSVVDSINDKKARLTKKKGQRKDIEINITDKRNEKKLLGAHMQALLLEGDKLDAHIRRLSEEAAKLSNTLRETQEKEQVAQRKKEDLEEKLQTQRIQVRAAHDAVEGKRREITSMEENILQAQRDLSISQQQVEILDGKIKEGKEGIQQRQTAMRSNNELKNKLRAEQATYMYFQEGLEQALTRPAPVPVDNDREKEFQK